MDFLDLLELADLRDDLLRDEADAPGSDDAEELSQVA